ncbi:MAG: L-threonylcarbamoyladenylate synthase [Thermodesulfobacteriota bacterium]
MKNAPEIRKTDALHPDPDLIEAACRVIRAGGVVAFPASSLYGLAADAFNRLAVDRVFRMKKRPADKPILLLIRDREALSTLAADIPPSAIRLMDAFWPGNVTLVFSAAKEVSGYLTSGTGRIGVRVPAQPVARALVNGLDNPITGTSANLSGHPGVDVASELSEILAEPPELILDAGKLKGGKGSTVVDVSVNPPIVLREGAVPAGEIFAALNLYRS